MEVLTEKKVDDVLKQKSEKIVQKHVTYQSMKIADDNKHCKKIQQPATVKNKQVVETFAICANIEVNDMNIAKINLNFSIGIHTTLSSKGDLGTLLGYL